MAESAPKVLAVDGGDDLETILGLSLHLLVGAREARLCCKALAGLPLRSRYRGGVAKLEYAPGLEPGSLEDCGFESRHPHPRCRRTVGQSVLTAREQSREIR